MTLKIFPALNDLIVRLIGDDSRGRIMLGTAPSLDGAQAGMLQFPYCFLCHPFKPRFGGWISCIENKPASRCKMLRDGNKHRGLILAGQKNLERMTSEKNQIELAIESKSLRVRFNPSDPLATWTLARDFKHGFCGVGPHHCSTIG